MAIAITIVIFMTMVSVYLAVRLMMYRRQTAHILEEISAFYIKGNAEHNFLSDEEGTNYRLSSCCSVGKTAEMITLFNKVLEHYRHELILLKRKNRAYRESITNISHDIRTPLTSAKGYLQMLSKNNTPAEKQKEYIATVTHRVDDVTAMLNQLFEYARVEAGELEFHMERINPANIFMDTISMFYDDFTQKGYEPKIEVMQGEEKTPYYIFADRQAVVRIIENLIKNALIHGTGGYEFTLKADSSRVRLTVSNNTNSIEENELDRIFERFYTTDKSRTRKTTGLGLAIVKQFTEHMDGSVSCSLEKGRLTVEVSFPSC